MRILYKTLFTIGFLYFYISGSKANEPLQQSQSDKVENKINDKKPVVSNDSKSYNSVNPVERELMSNDANNPKPVPNTNHQQTEPNIGKDYIEKWEITSAKTTAPGSVESFYMLSPNSYFKFLELNKIKIKLNDNFPEQTGTFAQSEFSIKIHLDNMNCPNCVKDIEITRQSLNDKFFKLMFDNSSQIISVKVVR